MTRAISWRNGAYTSIPVVGPGKLGENYGETRFGYDIMDRQARGRAPGGTITWKVYDVRDNVVNIFVGTDDTGATPADPTGGGYATNNMKNTVTNKYDNGSVTGGNNLLTSVIRHIGGTTATDYETDFGYDFRNRQVQKTKWIVYETTSVITVNTLDNNGNVTLAQEFNSTTSTTRLDPPVGHVVRRPAAAPTNPARMPLPWGPGSWAAMC